MAIAPQSGMPRMDKYRGILAEVVMGEGQAVG